MAKCPNCQHEIKDDFGLVACPNCGAQVLLSIDGSSEIASSGASGVSAVANLQQTLVQEVQNEVEAPNEEAGLSLDMSPPPPPPLDDESPVARDSGLMRTASPETVPQDRGLPATPDMSEVAAFGNSPASLAREGGLRFNIILSGIDSVDLRQQVKDALTDERFLWDAEALLARSHNGELKITDVSAVKSSLIIQRLRSVSIDIRWEQYAIHQ